MVLVFLQVQFNVDPEGYAWTRTNITKYSQWRCQIALCDGKLTKIPKRNFIFTRVKTGQVGTWSPTE